VRGVEKEGEKEVLLLAAAALPSWGKGIFTGEGGAECRRFGLESGTHSRQDAANRIGTFRPRPGTRDLPTSSGRAWSSRALRSAAALDMPCCSTRMLIHPWALSLCPSLRCEIRCQESTWAHRAGLSANGGGNHQHLHLFLPSLRPSSIIHHPSSIINHPSSIIHHPSSIIHHPSSIIHHPTSATNSFAPLTVTRRLGAGICLWNGTPQG
jgi:hypothetical protein